MPDHEHQTPEATIRAIQKAKGIKSKAAEYLGCSRWTVDNMCEKYPEVQRAYLEEREKLLDKGESKLLKLIESDDEKVQGQNVRFLLRTLGRDRGYGDTDVSLQRMKRALGDVTDLNLDALTSEELKVLRQLMLKASKEPVEHTQPQAFLSTNMTAKKAVKEIRSMDLISDIVKFVKGDTRKTVKRAAKQRKNAIQNQQGNGD